jgi:hypothetical protein
MRYLFTQDWNYASAGQIVDGFALPWPIPMFGIRALDQEALNALCHWYHEDLWRQFQYERGLQLPNPRFPPPAPQRRSTEERT